MIGPLAPRDDNNTRETVYNMAADNAVDGLIQTRKECYFFPKMHKKHKNGLLLENQDRTSSNSKLNDKLLPNGCEIFSKKNGFRNHVTPATVSRVRPDGIRASSLRSSPVRNKSMSVPHSDSSRNDVKSDCRLNGNSSKLDGSLLPCKWMECHFVASNVTELATHAQESHVDPMKCCDIFVCLWQDCKVFNRPSCSMSWLTKHLESHIGVKPFKCIFEGCSMSFSTQTGLARHVPCHFQDNVRQTKRNINSTGKEESPSKKQLRRKRLKYIRYKKTGLHGKVEDFVDQHAVDSIKTRLSNMIRTNPEPFGIDGSHIHLQSKVLGRRINEKAEMEVLLRWIPELILPDEWISADDVKKNLKRTVAIRCLPNDVKAELHPSFYRRLSHRKKRRK